ncbi:MAG TPA: enoyl-CoA hydratase-related protein [Gemmataceae bacterium]|nr:enoyl-CoA hydratase-related protein [Gemmataceae bacterium]
MSDNLVLYELRGPAAILKLNRPDKRNALSRALIAAIRDAVQRAKTDSAARCMIVTNAGPTFCAGMDLAELQQSISNANEQETIWNDALQLAEAYDLIYTLPKPTVAAVNGPAVAGGAGLVTVCDLAIATPASKFGYPEVRRGLVAAMVMPHLLRHVGERMARHLLLMGELVDAEAAKQSGLINEVVPAERLFDRALELARSIAAGGPQALAATKLLLHQFSRQTTSIQETAKASAAPRLGEECRAGLQAFFEKRPAPWEAS